MALVIAACSPKVRPTVTNPSVKTQHPIVKLQPEKKTVEKTTAGPQVASISMLLPLNLDNLNPGAQYTASTLEGADLSLDYYQGFKMALDSLTAKGYNYKLHLFDTKGLVPDAQQLAYNAAIRSSNIVIGPVFPEELHAFADILSGPPKLIVSPLSPSAPSAIKNSNLVTVATPLEYHARDAAIYIHKHYKPQKIFILRSGFSSENGYIAPFKKAIDSLGHNKIRIISPVISRGQLAALIPELSRNKDNVFVVPATDQQFLVVTLHSLDTLSKKYPVVTFGHPEWAHLSFLRPSLMMDIKAHFTTTNLIDYKSPEVAAFIRNYRDTYNMEPTHYALMGFDEGMIFGQMLGADPGSPADPGRIDYKGLLNTYHFEKKPGLGWINTRVNIMEYDNFELKKAE